MAWAIGGGRRMKAFKRIFNWSLCIGSYIYVWIAHLCIKDEETFLAVVGMIAGAGIMGFLNLIFDLTGEECD